MQDRSRFRGSFSRRSHAEASVQPVTQPTVSEHTQAQVRVAHPQPKAKKVGFFSGKRWLLAVIALLIVFIVLLGVGYAHTRNELKNAKSPETAGKTEVEQITTRIGKTLLLPTGEKPTLATVNDVSKLKNQVFFKNAQNGDKVLIFTKAGRAVLYRPSTGQVIEYAPVNLNGNQ